MSKTYDPKGIVMTCGGFQASGFADGTFLVVDTNEDDFTLQVGADGEHVRSKSNNSSGTFTLTLLQSAVFNDVLSAFRNTDRLSNGGQFPVLVKDLNGTTLYSAESAWVRKVSPSEFGNEAGGREWVIESGEIQAFVGGSN